MAKGCRRSQNPLLNGLTIESVSIRGIAPDPEHLAWEVKVRDAQLLGWLDGFDDPFSLPSLLFHSKLILIFISHKIEYEKFIMRSD